MQNSFAVFVLPAIVVLPGLTAGLCAIDLRKGVDAFAASGLGGRPLAHNVS
jgi:hypothetical protein